MGKALLNVDLAGQDLQALSGARTAGGAESQHRRSYNPGPESDGAGEGIEHSGSVCEMRNMGNHRVDGEGGKIRYLLDSVLRPFEITLGLAGYFDALRKVRTSAFQTSLGECLQFHEFALLGVQLAGAVARRCFSACPCRFQNQRDFSSFYIYRDLEGGIYTHVCACVASPRSNGMGSKVSCMRSFRTSTTSTPEYDPVLDS